jgi:ABC-type uncharacterized transport system substrate-binding protein
MINLFVKVDDILMTIYLDENTSIDNKTLLVKILNKFFIKKGFNNILDKVKTNKIDFFKIFYIIINSKYVKFYQDIIFYTNNLKDTTIYMHFTNTIPKKFNSETVSLVEKIYNKIS